MFAVHRIDEQLAKAMDRKVWLPSGGTLVIDRTEAMTVVDVNTGKFTGSGGNLEQTVTRNNLEAAEEIVRQLRLRDIGGIIVIDFIDMVLESNRDLVLRRLTEALARDRTRHQVSEVTSLGLVQLTRKKLGTGLIEAFSTHVHALRGPGHHAARRPRRLGAGHRAASPMSGRAARSKRGKKGGTRRRACPVAKVPAHLPASTRCSRRWRPPTASTKTTTRPTRRSTDEDDEGCRGSRRGSTPTTIERGRRRRCRRGPRRRGRRRLGRRSDEDDDDDSDDDEIDLDDDDEDDDEDDDIEVIDSDDDDSDDDGRRRLDDDDESTTTTRTTSDDEDDDDEDEDDARKPRRTVGGRRPRRRAAARPAGPPCPR